MKRPAPLILGVLFSTVLTLTGSVYAQQNQISPVRIDDAQEVASHRIGTLKPVVVHLTGEMSHLGVPLSIEVVVGTDGAVISAGLGDDVNFDSDDVPKNLAAELRRATEQALSEVRGVHYRPFEIDGQARQVTFEEEVALIPPEMLPGPHVDFPEIKNWNSLRITLDRTGCFGRCPSYSVHIRGDGTVTYNGGSFVALTGSHRGWIPKETVLEIVNAFQQADYFSLRDRYVAGITDNPTYTTSISFDGRTKEVVDYVGASAGMPDSVTTLEDAIDKICRYGKMDTRKFRHG